VLGVDRLAFFLVLRFLFVHATDEQTTRLNSDFDVFLSKSRQALTVTSFSVSVTLTGI